MITVNGEKMPWQEGMTVRDVLQARNFRFPLLIVTVNGGHVPPKSYETAKIPDSADVQAIHMMSGG